MDSVMGWRHWGLLGKIHFYCVALLCQHCARRLCIVSQTREEQAQGSMPGPSDLCRAAHGWRRRPTGQGWGRGGGQGFGRCTFQLSVR